MGHDAMLAVDLLALHANLELPGEDKASCTSKEQCSKDDIYDKQKMHRHSCYSSLKACCAEVAVRSPNCSADDETGVDAHAGGPGVVGQNFFRMWNIGDVTFEIPL